MEQQNGFIVPDDILEEADAGAATLKRRFHGGFTSVARSAWKQLDQWEHSF
jgi:hypothetical protein